MAGVFEKASRSVLSSGITTRNNSKRDFFLKLASSSKWSGSHPFPCNTNAEERRTRQGVLPIPIISFCSNNARALKPSDDKKLIEAKPKAAFVGKNIYSSILPTAGNSERIIVHSEAEGVRLDDNGGGGDSGNGAGKGFGNGSGGGDSSDEGKSPGSDGDSAGNFGPLLGLAQVKELASQSGVVLPDDMLAFAAADGLPALLLQRYLDLQKGFLAPFVRASVGLRDRLLADPAFLFKVVTEVCIDSVCATFAEVKQRGPDFWAEFDLYLSDLLVGIVLDVALVSMMAPAARLRVLSKARISTAAGTGRVHGLSQRLSRAINSLPNSIFEASQPTQKFSVGQRVATWFVKGAQYGVAGFVCGLVGQSIANGMIRARRHFNKSEEEEKAQIDLPKIIPTALLWGTFMAISSNTRYQVVNGLERVVESSVMAKRVPILASVFTVAVRFGNNVYGGMQFVDWARWSGVQ